MRQKLFTTGEMMFGTVALFLIGMGSGYLIWGAWGL